MPDAEACKTEKRILLIASARMIDQEGNLSAAEEEIFLILRFYRMNPFHM